LIDVDLKVEGLKATEAVIDRAARKTIYSVTKRIKEELKDEASSKLEIKRPWVLQGFRSRVDQIGPSNYRATLWHHRGFMKKHEDGDSVSTQEGSKQLIPFDKLREVGRTFKARRSWLKGKKAFEKDGALYFEEAEKLTRVATLKKETKYKKVTNYQEIAEKVIDDEAQELFRGYLRIV